MYASISGVTMLVAAGPLVTIATPGRPVTCAYPSAMWPAPCSWRTSMWRLLLLGSGSYAGRMQPPGRPNITSVPSISSDLIRAWAPVIFMGVLRVVACAANLPRKLKRPPDWEARDARADVDVRLKDEYEEEPGTHRR